MCHGNCGLNCTAIVITIPTPNSIKNMMLIENIFHFISFLIYSYSTPKTIWPHCANQRFSGVASNQCPLEFSMLYELFSITQSECNRLTLAQWSEFPIFVHKVKVAFSQKGLMRLSFLQTGKPNYFSELKFWILFPSKSCQKMTLSSSEWSKKALEQLKVLFWHDLSHLEGKRIQNFSSGK